MLVYELQRVFAQEGTMWLRDVEAALGIACRTKARGDLVECLGSSSIVALALFAY